MSSVIFWIVVFVISIYALVKSSSCFTDFAERIGICLKMNSFVVGVTIVALGTSMPELAAAIVSVFDGSPQIVSGVVVGSNIANIMLITGVCVFLSGSAKLSWNPMRIDIPFLLASVFFLWFTLRDGLFTYVEGLVGVVFYIVYSWGLVGSKKSSESGALVFGKVDSKYIIGLVVSCFFVWFSAKYVIMSICEISLITGIGKDVVALGAVALGTSLPELCVSVAAAFKSKFDLAIGNVIGSNIFNSFIVMGLPSFFATLPVTDMVISVSVPIMMIASVFFCFVLYNRKVSSYEGIVMVLFYVFFMG